MLFRWERTRDGLKRKNPINTSNRRGTNQQLMHWRDYRLEAERKGAKGNTYIHFLRGHLNYADHPGRN